MKDYLAAENARNHRNHRLYERFLRMAFGPEATVLVAHHLNYEVAEGSGGEPIEIPSADTMMFCHELMEKVFGIDDMHYAMAQLAVRPVEERDPHFELLLDRLEEKKRVKNLSVAESTGGSENSALAGGSAST